MRKELKCNFVEDEDEEEEEEEDDEVDAEFNDKVEQVLSGNDSINNCDEFKYYTQVMKFLKKMINKFIAFWFKKLLFLQEMVIMLKNYLKSGILRLNIIIKNLLFQEKLLE